MDSCSVLNSKLSIVNHRLVGPGVVQLECRKNSRRMAGPDMIILHYTAGTDAMGTAKYLASRDVPASAHLVIGREGELIQLVAFNIEAWHAGKSSFEGRSGLNQFSIGIELDNMGLLRLEGGRFVAECGREVAVRDVYVEDSGSEITYWHRYTDVQVKVLEKVCGLLIDYYPIRDILGHSDVTSRKVDPGPALQVAEWMKYY